MVLCAFAACLVFSGSARAGELAEVHDFGTNPGNLGMRTYIPENLQQPAALLVVLHGCGQSVEQVAAAGWLELAEEFGFLLIFPEQRLMNNPSGCFNWAGEYGDLSNLVRGEGENQSIIEMVESLRSAQQVAPDKIFVTGFSSGGAMAAIMLATWPDVFSAGALVAGIPYACSQWPWEAQPCIMPGIDRGPSEWAERVRSAFPAYLGPYPRVSLWQNSRDPIVGVDNLSELVEQWTEVHGVDRVPDEIVASGAASLERFADADGQVVVEAWLIEQAGHGIPIDPSHGCGSASAFVLDAGICFARQACGFFGIGAAPDSEERPARGVFEADLDRRPAAWAAELEGRPLDLAVAEELEDEELMVAEAGCQSAGGASESSAGLLLWLVWLLGAWALRR